MHTGVVEGAVHTAPNDNDTTRFRVVVTHAEDVSPSASKSAPFSTSTRLVPIAEAVLELSALRVIERVPVSPDRRYGNLPVPVY